MSRGQKGEEKCIGGKQLVLRKSLWSEAWGWLSWRLPWVKVGSGRGRRGWQRLTQESALIRAADLPGHGMWIQESWTSLGNYRKTKNNLLVRGALEDLHCITASARNFYNM